MTYVIADIGACHDADPSHMGLAIREAKVAGADAIKFQWTSDPWAMAKRRGPAKRDGYGAIYQRYLAWPQNWLETLEGCCAREDLDFMCTVFLAEDVQAVAHLVSKLKVASFEADDVEMLDASGCYGKDVVVSAGFRTRAAALAIQAMTERSLAGSAGTYVLHCVSSYPAPLDALHLAILRRPPYRGFSDHSAPELTFTGALAVAAGAEVVEAHLRLEVTDPGNPDFPHAMTPQQFGEYAGAIRAAERATGSFDTERWPEICEAGMAVYRVAPSDS